MSEHLTELANRACSGDAAAVDALFRTIYDELRRSAELLLRHEKPGHTLQPTALVHEAYLKLVPGFSRAGDTSLGHDGIDVAGRTHLLAIGARAMRQVLIDHARTRDREKRGKGWRRILLGDALSDEGAAGPLGDNAADASAIHEAIERLRARDVLAADLVELRIFGGLRAGEAALALGVPQRTAEREWAFARAWLRRALSQEETR